jgi:hypothetical protein
MVALAAATGADAELLGAEAALGEEALASAGLGL